ncbi:17932_t:CDS:2, partial [Cetraspora pellucida]
MPAIFDERAFVDRDIGQDVKTRITPSKDEITTLIIIGVYMLVILILWRMPILNYILYPFKLLTVGLHEWSHAAAGCCTGAKIEGIKLDPDEGGVTQMRGGIQCCTLPAGAILIFCGFNVVASKAASVVLGVLLIILLFWAKNWLTRGITVFFVIVIVVLWIVENGVGLRYFVLFVGVMSCLYSLWDILDDLVFRKVNESDASQFAKLCRCCPAQVWG